MMFSITVVDVLKPDTWSCTEERAIIHREIIFALCYVYVIAIFNMAKACKN
jgi:hypothetical protein